jgi:hypothetical protein
MKIGVLELRGDDFTQSVVSSLPGVEAETIRVGEIRHPSPCPYRLVIDRMSFSDPFLREVVRYWAITGTYVINNPFYTLTSDKLSDIVCCDRLGISTPRTVLLPRPNPEEDLSELVAAPDWDGIAAAIGFPCILKPVDGYAWQDVFVVEGLEQLRSLYESLKGRRTLILQELIRWTEYYRAFCVGGSDVLLVRWTPRPFDMGVYAEVEPGRPEDLLPFITERTAALNRSLGLDFNSVEWCVTADRRALVIDSFNDVPDVRRSKMPAACYQWIVERFGACVRQRLEEGRGNSPFIPGMG